MTDMLKKYFVSVIAFLCIFMLGAMSVVNAVPVKNIAVILIVDNSGSMKTSDPAELRFTGVRLFASMLDPGDSLGLIIFSTQAETLTHGLVTLDAKEQSAALLRELDPPPAHGYTDVKAALENTREMIGSAALNSKKIVIVLLTDGKPEIPNPYPRYEQETLDLARALNAPLIAIALTSAAQTPFLDQLAEVTQGMVVPANDSSDLLGAYLQVLGQIKDRTVVGGKKSMSAPSLEIDQALSPYINSVTFIVAKPEKTDIQLLGSDGREIGRNESTDARVSLFTLEDPVGGVYSFRSQGKGEMQVWGILRSRLRVQVVSPAAVQPLNREMKIVVNLLEETSQGKFTKIIGEANFTALITGPDGKETSLDRFYDDGAHGDLAADDGNYTRTYPKTEQGGTYLISIQGWKGAIPVSAETRIQVLPFPEIVVDAPLGSMEVRGESIELRVHLQSADSLDTLRMTALISSPFGEVQEFEMQGDGSYTANFLPLESGEYHVSFETRDAVYRGVEYQTKAEQSFAVTVIPFVHLAMQEIEMPAACLSKPKNVVVSLMANSSGEGLLRFSASNGWEVKTDDVQIKKGEQTIQLTLNPQDELSAGIQQVKLLVGSADRFEIQPQDTLDVEFQVPNIWTRCRTPIRFGEGILALIFMGGVSIRHARKVARPMPVSGTLRHWEIGKNPALAEEIDLTIFGKHTLLIGGGVTCDVMIPHAELASEHARVMAEKIPDGVEMVLEPIGEVRKGYSQQIARFTLRHGELFRMGSHEFQYLSDSGN